MPTMNVSYGAGAPPGAYPGQSRYLRQSQGMGSDVLYSREYLRRFYPNIDKGYNPYADPNDIHYNPIFDPDSPYFNAEAAEAWNRGLPVTRTGGYRTNTGAFVPPPDLRAATQAKVLSDKAKWEQAQANPRPLPANFPKTGQPPPATWQNDRIRPGFYGPTGRYMGIGRRPGAPPPEEVRRQFAEARAARTPSEPPTPKLATEPAVAEPPKPRG